MRWKALAIVPLIFLAGGAAPPQDDCIKPPSAVQTLPTALDETSQPVATGGLTNQTSAVQPTAGNATGCQSVLPIPTRAATLTNESGDVLHGLPETDSLRRIDEPRQAPMFQ